MLSRSEGSIIATKFDADDFRELVASAIIMRDLSFQFVEWVAMKKMLCYLRPKLHIVSRNTYKADCLRIYNREKSKIKSLLASIPGRTCLTSDCWSSLTTDGYICLTAHFIDKDWNLQKKILNFCYLPPPHSGVALCEKIHHFLSGWQMDDRIFTITLDYASSNDVCAGLLRNLLATKGDLLLQGDFFT